ncbi:MAG: hypothetical protein WAM39_13250 [Bryobacteraceae bacterium]
MPDELSFEVGDCIAISFCNLKYPSTQIATVIRSTRHSFVADFKDGSSPRRYFRKDGRWRNQFGYRVTVATANSGNQPQKERFEDRSGSPSS